MSITRRTRRIEGMIPTCHVDAYGKYWPGTTLILSCGHRQHYGGSMLPKTVTWECGQSPCYVPSKVFAG